MKIFYTILLVISMTIISCSQASSDEASSKEISEKSVNRLSVIMNEWEVRPTPNYKMGKHIPPGDIEITLTNAGKLVHNMYVLNQSSYDDFTILDDETADLSEIEVLLEIPNRLNEGYRPNKKIMSNLFNILRNLACELYHILLKLTGK